MESWRLVWREGIAPSICTAGLEHLLKALETDDPALIRGSTTSPPPLMCVQDWPCEKADAIAFTGWKGGNLRTVGEVEEYFARVCWECDQRMGEPAAVRWFLNWHDDINETVMRRELAAEVKLAIAERELVAA